MEVRIEPRWRQELAQEWEAPYFEELTRFVRQRYGETVVFPPPGRIFAAFDACPFDGVKVVILGQDPYHERFQANGLCFSVNDGEHCPPSLVNIFKEMSDDLNVPYDKNRSGNLDYLARQGVLLLNSTLTVEEHKAGSHQGRGWERLTDAAVKALNDRLEGVVFMLWGSYAQHKGVYIDRHRHLVLEAAHPSPLSAYRGFFGCRHFSKANSYLLDKGKEPVRWL